MSGELATTAGAVSFTGADVDGLDHLAQEFNGAAEIVDMVKMACEVIVAAASIFGPFGAAFVAYLKATVIPWLTKVSAALKAMSKVLSMHSAAQKDASSSTTSLPTYPGTPNLPTTSTYNAPTLPPASTSVAPASPAAPTTTGSSVAAPPTIGGTAPTTTAPTATGTTTGQDGTPFVQAVTALTGLVTAVDHLIHPGGTGTPTPTVPPTDPGTTPPIDPGTTPPTEPGTTPTGSIPTVPGAPPVLGSSGGIDLSTLHPLHPGDTVGVLSIPVDIAPDGTVTPLIHTPLDPAGAPATPIANDATSAPAAIAPATHPPDSPAGTSDGGSGGGSGTDGDTGGGSAPNAPVTTGAPPADAVTTAAHTPDATAAQAEPGLRTQTIGSHDGLFTGIGQATGIGAGAAALARAVLSETRQSGDGSILGAVPMPFDANADGAARTEIFQGSIT